MKTTTRTLFCVLGFFLLAAVNSFAVAETSLTFDSQGGDWVGQGQQLYYSAEDGTFLVRRSGRNGVAIVFTTPSYFAEWFLEFDAADNKELALGVYVDTSYFYTLSAPMLQIDGQGRGCNGETGVFRVKEISYGPGDTINSFWATFEQHCESALPALFGEIRYNANTAVTVTAPAKRVMETGKSLSFKVAANVTSGDVATVTATGLPLGATFVDNPNNTGTFTWTPASNQTGYFVIGFSAANPQGGFDSTTTVVAVGTVIRVPSDFATIQAAIDSAPDGSRIMVSPGIYQENINFLGKWITVKSDEGPEVTTIDGNQQDSVVAFESGEDSDSVLDGFTIKNGRSYWDTPGYGNGGGIRVWLSSPTITRNVITENQACDGSGISIESGSGTIEDNIITRNKRLFYCVGGVGGGGISIVHGPRVKIRNNIISNNSSEDGGGISAVYARTLSIERNIIVDNVVTGTATRMTGGGISISNFSDVFASDNLIAGNSAMYGGGVYWLVASNAQGPVFINNTIVDNNATQLGSEIYATGFDANFPMVNNVIGGRENQPGLFCDDSNGSKAPVLHFSNVYSSLGSAYGGACLDQTSSNGNISQDPLFVNPSQLDYRLSSSSPAIDGGDSSTVAIPLADLAGNPRILDGNGDDVTTIDMGAYEFISPQPSRSDLTLLSLDLRAGVHIMIDRSDSKGATGGYTPFTRTYDNNASVTLAAPASVAGSAFQKWQRDGVDWDTNLTTQLVMDCSHTMTAIYAPLDTIAPQTIITDGPPLVMAGDAIFNWTGTDNASPTMKLVYAYRLNPIDSKWSAFSSATTKTFSNLASGTYYFSVKAKDEAGNEDPDPPGWSFTVTPNVAPVAIGVLSVPDGEAGVKYSAGLAITGGRLPHSISVTSGSLPNGLSIVKETIVGTPAVAGEKSFTITVTDQLGGSVSRKLQIKIAKAVGISTKSIKAGKVNKAYNARLAATGGQAPYSWSLVSGTLPNGLIFDPSSGSISGTPTTAATANLAFHVTDALGGTVQKTLALRVK